MASLHHFHFPRGATDQMGGNLVSSSEGVLFSLEKGAPAFGLTAPALCCSPQWRGGPDARPCDSDHRTEAPEVCRSGRWGARWAGGPSASSLAELVTE